MPRKRKINLPLVEVIGISVLLHVGGLFILGGLTLYEVLKPEEPEFEAPPVVEAIDNKPQKMKVQLQKQTKKSSPPTQKIVVRNISQLNLPNVDLNMPVMDTRVAVGGGVGGGIGRGFGSGGIDMAKSAVNFFGIQDSGENVAFLLDTARSMLERERGDVWGYDRVKEEIAGMIRNLSPGTLFNIYAYDDNLQAFRPTPVAATNENKEAAAKWISQFWVYDKAAKRFLNQGAKGFDILPDMSGMPLRRENLVREGEHQSRDAKFSLEPLGEPQSKIGVGTSRMDLAVLAAVENRADAIFLVTDGTPDVRRTITPQILNDYIKKYDNYWRMAENNKDFQKWQEEMEAYRKQVERFQENRIKRGLPPEVREDGNIGGIKRPTPPKELGWPPILNPIFDQKELASLVGDRVKQLYRERNTNPPPLHVVGYSTTDREEAIIDMWQDSFRGGKFRVITPDDLKVEEDGKS